MRLRHFQLAFQCSGKLANELGEESSDLAINFDERAKSGGEAASL